MKTGREEKSRILSFDEIDGERTKRRKQRCRNIEFVAELDSPGIAQFVGRINEVHQELAKLPKTHEDLDDETRAFLANSRGELIRSFEGITHKYLSLMAGFATKLVSQVTAQDLIDEISEMSD